MLIDHPVSWWQVSPLTRNHCQLPIVKLNHSNLYPSWPFNPGLNYQNSFEVQNCDWVNFVVLEPFVAFHWVHKITFDITDLKKLSIVTHPSTHSLQVRYVKK
jgi:hypothetical protein